MDYNFRIIDNKSSDWEAECKGFAKDTHGRYKQPKGVIICDSANSLQAALNFVSDQKVLFCLRSGRHSYEGQSSNAPGGYIIDTSAIKTKKWIGFWKFRLGAGLTQIEMVRYLERFGCSIPYATGGTVGLAGLVLGGGVGLSSRTWGTVAHHVIRLRCVLADGSLRWIDGKSDEGKAIMSAGGGSIVALAEIEVRVHWKPMIPIFSVEWSKEDAKKVLLALDHNGPSSDRRLGFVARFGINGTVALYGQCNSGGYITTQKLLRKLISGAPKPTKVTIVFLPHFLASRQFFRVSTSQPNGWHAKIGSQLFKSISTITKEPITNEIAEGLIKAINAHPKLKNYPEEVSMIQMLVGGGKLWDQDHSHIPHYKSCVLYQFDGYWLQAADRNAVMEWVFKLQEMIAPISIGSYINYIDDTIPANIRNQQYYGEANSSIVSIKRLLDSKNFYEHNHSPKI